MAELQDEWWINKVGTYGMASAQLYWGRTAALILRLLYLLFPQVDSSLWMTSGGSSEWKRPIIWLHPF